MSVNGTKKKTYKSYKKKNGKKNKIYSNKQTQSIVSSVGKPRKKKTLTQRMDELESNAKKHFDICSRPGGVEQVIEYNGITYTGAPPGNLRNCFKGFLNIQGMGQLPAAGGAGNQNIMPEVSGNFKATENNVRIGESCFVNYARLRGVIQAKQPAALQNFLAAGTGRTEFSDTAAQGDSQTTIWLVILKDKRPSTVTTGGLSVPNPPWDLLAGTRPMETLSQVDTAGNISLEAHGFTNFLASYDSTRFDVHYKKAYTLTYAKPRQFIDVQVKINKKLIYENVALASNNNKAPLNFNLYVYLVQDQIADLSDMQMHKPVLLNWTSRTYFKDN